MHKAKWHKVIENNEGLGGGLAAWQGVSVHVVAISCKFVFRFGMLAWGAILFFTKGEGEHARTGRRHKAPRGCACCRGNSTLQRRLAFSMHLTKSFLTEPLAHVKQKTVMRNFSNVAQLFKPSQNLLSSTNSLRCCKYGEQIPGWWNGDTL